MNKYLIIAVIAGTIGGYFFGVDVTNTKCVADTQTAINDAVASARAEEKIKQDKVNETIQTQLDNLSTINSQLNDDLIKLRNRPSRRDSPGDTGSNCKGSSGADLSEPDAAFLTREAARADRLREALIACYGYADSIQ